MPVPSSELASTKMGPVPGQSPRGVLRLRHESRTSLEPRGGQLEDSTGSPSGKWGGPLAYRRPGGYFSATEPIHELEWLDSEDDDDACVEFIRVGCSRVDNLEISGAFTRLEV